ncbi:MAG: hypothetical protein AAF961_15160 [Planctomycetota bacterium]
MLSPVLIRSLPYVAYLALATAAYSSSAADSPSSSDQQPESKVEDKPKEPSLQTVEAGGVTWHTDYYAAYRDARAKRRMLLINFVAAGSAAQANLESRIARNANLKSKLAGMTLVRLPSEAAVDINGRTTRLLDHSSFSQMHRRPGIAMLDLKHSAAPYYGRVVSAFPFMSSKYYRWRSDYLSTLVDLPAGTLTQRTMVWAVRVHPERPASTNGMLDAQLASAATRHSQHQANIQVQGHHNWDRRFHQVRGMVGAHEASEVVAESWPNQNMIDSCLDCVDSWRHSSGHWGAVRRLHRFYAYDIRRGRNGIWYGTGIFAN